MCFQDNVWISVYLKFGCEILFCFSHVLAKIYIGPIPLPTLFDRVIVPKVNQLSRLLPFQTGWLAKLNTPITDGIRPILGSLIYNKNSESKIG